MRVDTNALGFSSSSPKTTWSCGVVDAVVGSNLFKTYRVRFDDGKTWEGALRDPFYELVVDGDAALLRADQNVDRKHFTDAIALATQLAERPLACAELSAGAASRRWLRHHPVKGDDARRFDARARARAVCGAPLEDETFRAGRHRVPLRPPRPPGPEPLTGPLWPGAARRRRRLRRVRRASAQATLARLLRIGVLQANAPAEDTLIGAALDAVRAAQPGATWQTLSLNAHLAEMSANNTQASMPPWNALADFDGAAWPEDEPRDLAKFAAAVVVADAVHTEHAARQRFFVSGSELVALRCKLASLNFQAGRNSSWRVIGVERLSGLRNAVEQATRGWLVFRYRKHSSRPRGGSGRGCACRSTTHWPSWGSSRSRGSRPRWRSPRRSRRRTRRICRACAPSRGALRARRDSPRPRLAAAAC